MAWSDRDWLLDGATVHVSIVGFDDGTQTQRMLDGEAVSVIHADLTCASDLVTAKALTENKKISFRGFEKNGAFEISEDIASEMNSAPLNPNGRPNFDVIKPWVNAMDIASRPRGLFIIDFGTDMSESDAALYEKPFEHVRRVVKPIRDKNNREHRRSNWWLHGETNPGLRSAIGNLRRFIVTPRHSKYRLFTWVAAEVLADSALVVFTRDDDYFLGILHSRLHEQWSRHTGTQVRDAESGFRYTPLVCFDPFPFPWPPGHEPQDSPLVEAIAEAARELVEKRDAWLNPPDTSEEELKRRTLTNLYNARPSWLAEAHRKLDAAVFAAYGWPLTLTDAELLERLLALNHERAAS
jgi:type II restriction/modification system DNA methylase subunit YeeA